MRFFLIGIILVLSQLSAFGQAGSIPLNTWRIHSNFYNIKHIQKVNNTIFCAGENGLYAYDLITNEVTALTRNQGWSDNGISTMAYDQVTKTFIVCYESGSIDLLKNGRVFNLTEIKTTQNLSGSRRINAIDFDRGFAYLACDFGIVSVNLTKVELSETYIYIGPNGSAAEVYDIAVNPLEDSLYAATNIGIVATSLKSNVNRYNFTNWKTFNAAQNIPSTAFKYVVYYQNTIYAGQNPGLLFKKESNGLWSGTGVGLTTSLASLTSQENQLVFCYNTEIVISNTLGSVTVQTQKIPRPQSVILSGNNLFVGDQFNGLVIAKPSDTTNLIYNGPLVGRPVKMIGFEDKVSFLSGGYYGTFIVQISNNFGISMMENGYWNNINQFFGSLKGKTPSGQDTVLEMYDPIVAVYNDISKKVFYGCFGFGIYSMDETGYFRRYGMNDGILKSAQPPGVLEDQFIRITALGLDPSENLWAFNYSEGPSGNTNYLHKIVFQSNGNFDPGNSRSYQFPINIASDLQVDFYGNVWLLLSNNTLLVFNESEGQRAITSQPNQGGLPGSFVRCIDRDLVGNIWVGTEDGLAVFYSPGKIVGNDPLNASIPIYQRRPLFKDQSINSIKADGGNRKWVATTRGAWLINENGSEILQNFTDKNSPLLNEEIKEITIIPKTGEVFFNSEKGVVSFRSDATLPDFKDPCKNIYSFPNPVEPGYNGLVAINDLPYNSNIKITDITGRLHYETKSNGGTATWGLKDYSGKRAEPGIFLVFISDEEGEQTCIHKVALIE